MIRSMTAFARQEKKGEMGHLSWELRSVNHRYLDVSMRLPEDFRKLENLIRERITKALGRGKIECNLRFQAEATGFEKIQINTEFAKIVAQAATEASAMLGNPAPLSAFDLLRWPGVLQESESDLTPLHDDTLQLLDAALAELIETRGREGSQLAAILSTKVEAMLAAVSQISKRQPEVLRLQREKLAAKLADFREDADSNRLEQEMVIQAQRLDIAEEIERLETHLAEVMRVLKANKPTGRRLDFLMQELNREANTIGSKSADSEVTQHSVEMKVLIEQMREQVQNIE